MSNLLQLIYMSRATFASTPGARGVDPTVARILAKSRANNRQAGLAGVMVFGDGCFFQCLEGDAAVVDALYAKLERDDRHTDMVLISRCPITRHSFSDWSMKYVMIDKALERLLLERGHQSFDPYAFDAETTQALMKLLQVTESSDTPPAMVSL